MTELQREVKRQYARINRIIQKAELKGFSFSGDFSYNPRKATTRNLERLRTINLSKLVKNKGATYSGEATQLREVSAAEGLHAVRSAAALKREQVKREKRERERLFSIFDRTAELIGSIPEERGIRKNGKWQVITLTGDKTRMYTVLEQINQTEANARALTGYFPRLVGYAELIELDSNDKTVEAAIEAIIDILSSI